MEILRTKKKKIIIFVRYFLPGFKSGGPARTILNLIDNFSKYCDFGVVCNFKDLGETKPYSNIRMNQWNKTFEKYNVFYCDIQNLRKKEIINLCAGFDVVYCCGCYDIFSIKLSRCAKKGLVPKLYIAPMGIFSPGALCIKKLKKKIFYFFAKRFNLFKAVTWSFSNNIEREDYERLFKHSASHYIIASDLPRSCDGVSHRTLAGERAHPLKIIFLSRVCKMKNLLQAIQIVNDAKCTCIFDIYGFKEDINYFNKCESEIKKLRNGVTCQYRGPVNSENVTELFTKYDVLLLPTLGENYGHVIFESMQSGCVPIISTNTPWNLDENHCGYCIPLEEQGRFVAAVDALDLDRALLVSMANNGIEFTKKFTRHIIENSGYWNLLK